MLTDLDEAVQNIQVVTIILQKKWDGRQSAMERAVMVRLEEALRKIESSNKLLEELTENVRRIEGE